MSALPSINITPSAPPTERSEDHPLSHHPLTQNDRLMTTSVYGEGALDGAYQHVRKESPHLTLPPIQPDRGLSRKKSEFYDNAFAIRSSHHSAKERVVRDSVVLADMVTNADIENSYTFITDLSYNLSSRYQRSESSILCTLNSEPTLILDGSFAPAYVLTITAHPSLLGPVTNKRNAAIFARGMEEALKIPPARGLIRFLPAAEHCFAVAGKTLAAAIDELETEQRDKIVPGAPRKRSSLSSLRGMSLRRAKAPELATQDEEDEDAIDGFTPLDAPSEGAPSVGRSERERKIAGRKSFASLLFRR